MSGSNEAPKPGDPAMDDILASIRRILNEDDGTQPGTPGGAARLAEAPAEPLDLTEAMMVQAPGSPPETTPEPPRAAPAPASERRPPEPTTSEAPLAPPEPPAAPAAEVPAELLVAPAVAAATTAAVGKLLRAVVQERAATVSRGGPSIEDVVREEVRPLLKEWLDQHLPPIVERLVRAEIERVVGRAL
jgi:cell pole-organizing protein PopZ